MRELLQAAERTLQLDRAKRCRTLVHVDAGGGSLAEVNWLLWRGYQLLCKDYSSTRTRRLAQSVETWVDDPQVQGRQIGWVTKPATEYVRPVKRIAVRCRKQDGQWGIGVLISTLTDVQLLSLSGREAKPHRGPEAVLLACVSLYDQRGGGVEPRSKATSRAWGLASGARSDLKRNR